jgi:hypothetical protein
VLAGEELLVVHLEDGGDAHVLLEGGRRCVHTHGAVVNPTIAFSCRTGPPSASRRPPRSIRAVVVREA